MWPAACGGRAGPLLLETRSWYKYVNFRVKLDGSGTKKRQRSTKNVVFNKTRLVRKRFSQLLSADKSRTGALLLGTLYQAALSVESELVKNDGSVNLRLKLDGAGTKTSNFADFVGSCRQLVGAEWALYFSALYLLGKVDGSGTKMST